MDVMSYLIRGAAMASAFQPLPKTAIKDNGKSGDEDGERAATLPKGLTAFRRKRILHVEFDRTLLAVRHALLESAGFEVISCFSGLALREVSRDTLSFDLFLVGHAASVAERSELVIWLKGNFPEAVVVVVRARETDSFPSGDIITTAEPEELLRTLFDVLNPR
jgi:hypothetical protein